MNCVNVACFDEKEEGVGDVGEEAFRIRVRAGARAEPGGVCSRAVARQGDTESGDTDAATDVRS